MDLLYILGKGSKWENNELRYSLRSIEKHLSGVGSVYLIGEKPEWIKNVHHIPFEDKKAVCKQSNIMRKIYEGTKQSGLSSDFIFMNDDHYLLQNFDVSEMKFWYDGLMSEKFKRCNYVKYANCIGHVIDEVGDGNYFDVHTPIVYNRTLFRDVMDRFDWSMENTYVIKSLYCNWLGIPGEYLKDNKTDFHEWKAGVKHNEDKLWYSSPEVAGSGVQNYLAKTFPEKSGFEK